MVVKMVKDFLHACFYDHGLALLHKSGLIRSIGATIREACKSFRFRWESDGALK